jgi:hypothetical protein
VKEKMPDMFEKMSEGINKEFDVEVALKLSQVVPLDPHYEAENAFAYSMYFTIEESNQSYILAATITFVNVAGKVLFLYTYGSQDDLEWTRMASKAWAEEVMESNTQPPSHSPVRKNIDWSSVLEKGILGAVVGGLVALFLGVYSRFRKKEDKRVN